jgi:hypothetical protein
VTTVGIPGVGHFWFTASAITGQHGISECTLTQPVVCTGATPNDFLADKLLAFLRNNL